jgi:hypothetical protein
LRRLSLHFLVPLALLAAYSPAAPEVTATAPIKNFKLPTFTDEGFRRMMVRALEASLPDPAKIDLKEMELTLFTGRADEKIDAMLAAPVATFLPEKQFASGAETVRLERADLTLTGADWSYDHPGQKVIIRRDAHLIFHATLGDIIK